MSNYRRYHNPPRPNNNTVWFYFAEIVIFMFAITSLALAHFWPFETPIFYFVFQLGIFILGLSVVFSIHWLLGVLLFGFRRWNWGDDKLIDCLPWWLWGFFFMIAFRFCVLIRYPWSKSRHFSIVNGIITRL